MTDGGEVAAEIRRSEARFAAIFHASPVGVAITRMADGLILDVNASFLEVFGYERAEVIGHSSAELGLWIDADAGEQLLAILHKHGRARNVELRIRTKCGAIRQLLYAIEQIELVGEPCMLSYGQDITTRKQAEDAVHASAEYLRALVEHSSEIITVLNADGSVRYTSPAQQKVLGYVTDERGAAVFVHIHPYDRPHLQALFDELRATPDRVLTTELRARHADGSWRVLEVTATNLLTNPAVGGIVVNSHDITERRRVAEQLAHDAFHDVLTGMPNRALFLDRLRQTLDRATRVPERKCAVLFLDLDRFKTVNDSLGHLVGDDLLVAAARRLEQCVRPGDTVARFGGDEFAILLADLPTNQTAAGVAERITAAFRLPFMLQGQTIVTSASIGITICAGPGGQPNDLLRDADIAMYHAKRSGRPYVVADPSMHAGMLARLQLEAELRQALEQEEFILYYQPKMSIDGRTIQGVEALVRWQHPTRGLVAPGEFIALAEELGLIAPLGEWVLRTACAQLRTWQDAGLLPLFICVNLSAQQFKQRNLATTIRTILEETGLDAQHLCLELTENMLMEDAETTVAALQELRTIGIGALAVDDFGTGYSSLSYLRRFPVNEIKIDRSFVLDSMTNPSNAAIASAIIALAHSLDLKAIAEGVETEEQRAFLERAGCDCFQGYLVSRPIPADQLVLLIHASNLLGPFAA